MRKSVAVLRNKVGLNTTKHITMYDKYPKIDGFDKHEIQSEISTKTGKK